MAKAPRSRKIRRSSGTAWNPLQSRFRTTQDFDRAVSSTAKGYYQPQLDDVNAQAARDNRAHAERGRELYNWYGGFQNSLNAAAGQTQNALNAIIANQHASDEAAARGLGAALRSSNVDLADRGSTFGATPNTNQMNDIAQTALASAQSGSGALAGNLGSMISAAADRRTLAPIGGLQAVEAENRRARAATAGTDKARTAIMRQVPSYLTKAAQELSASELARNNQKFQQWLAGKQFGLQKQQLQLQRDQLRLDGSKATDQSRLNWAQLGLQRDELMARIQGAGGESKDKRAQAYAGRFDKAATWLDTYTTPGTQDVTTEDPRTGKKTKGKQATRSSARFITALRAIRTRFGISHDDALRLMSSVDLPGWHSRASTWLRSGKDPFPAQLKKNRTKRAAKGLPIVGPRLG